MTTKFILIVILLSGSPQGRTGFSVQFDNKQACEHAAQTLANDTNDEFDGAISSNGTWAAYCFSVDKPQHSGVRHRQRKF